MIEYALKYPEKLYGALGQHLVLVGVTLVLSLLLAAVLVWRGVSYGWFDMRSEMLLDVLIVIIVVALRLLSVGFNVTLPGAVERHRVYLPSESRYLKRPVIHPHADTVDPGKHADSQENDKNRYAKTR